MYLRRAVDDEGEIAPQRLERRQIGGGFAAALGIADGVEIARDTHDGATPPATIPTPPTASSAS